MQQPDPTNTPGTAPKNALAARALHAAYGEEPVLQGIDLNIQSGAVTGLVGPNGSGKSTLLRIFGRLLKHSRGEVEVHGKPIASYGGRELAQTLALMPQALIPPPGVTVRELVGYGRTPYTSWLRGMSAKDAAIIDDLLDRCDLNDLAPRMVATLSGGEKQRAWIAMALAQQPDVLLLDEPVSALDIGHQLEVLDLLREVNRDDRTTIVMVLHDLNLAARYCDQIAAIRDGKLITHGPTDQVIQPAYLQQCFGVRASVHRLEDSPSQICTFERMAKGQVAK